MALRYLRSREETVVTTANRLHFVFTRPPSVAGDPVTRGGGKDGGSKPGPASATEAGSEHGWKDVQFPTKYSQIF